MSGGYEKAIRENTLRAFQTLKERRGSQVALCATARKLAVLSWHLLTRGEDSRHSADTITQRKLRTLQRKAGDSGARISLAAEATAKSSSDACSSKRSATTGSMLPPTGRGATNGEATL